MFYNDYLLFYNVLYCLAFASQMLNRNIYQIPLLFWVVAYMICHPLPFWARQRFLLVLTASFVLLMYVQSVINLHFLFWPLFLPLPSPLAKLVTCRPAPSPSCSFGEPANVCWGTSWPLLWGFYLHAPFLADHFQISWHGAFQPIDCSTGLQHLQRHPAPWPFHVGTDLLMLLPLGSPAIAPRQHPAEQRRRSAVGQVPAGWV